MKKPVILMLALVPLIFAGKILMLDPAQSDFDHGVILVEDNEFVGADRCRTCHRKEEQGGQYGIWQEGAHAKAYETLATDEAKKIAAEKGIDNPQEADECLECHTTAFGIDASLLGSKFKIEDGVSCEACHGAGGGYFKKKTMQGIMGGEIDPATVGLIIKADEEACVACHNEESPTYKAFSYEERLEEIAHPIPDARKAEYQ